VTALREEWEPEGWTSTTGREALVAAVDDLARLLDPTRPALGEPEISYDAEPMGSMGETSSTATRRWPTLRCTVHTYGINDGATPDTDDIEVEALGLGDDRTVTALATLLSPVHNQASIASVSVFVADGIEVPTAVRERLEACSLTSPTHGADRFRR
jgi:hypothetical protein